MHDRSPEWSGCSETSRLILGHESLGEVVDSPPALGFAKGDLVVGIVRRPDPVPCASCAAGEWDMCKNGRYTERGIKGLHGFGSEMFRVEPDYLVKIDERLGLRGVLVEPASVVAKAWEHIERIAERAVWRPRTVLVTGAGPIGLLAALLGVQRGLDVRVLDRVTGGPKPGLVRDLGASYFSGTIEDAAAAGADVVLECTGAAPLVIGAMRVVAPDGIVCLTGLSSGGRRLGVDVAGLNRELVLENNVVFGSVNANRRHYQSAVRALGGAEPGWLDRMLSRRVPLSRWQQALERRPTDVKPVLVFE